MRFILRGKAYVLSPRDVVAKMHGISPEAIRKYYVIIEGNKYPPKQVLGEVVGLGRVEFTTMDATNILRRLGFALGSLKSETSEGSI